MVLIKSSVQDGAQTCDVPTTQVIKRHSNQLSQELVQFVADLTKNQAGCRVLWILYSGAEQLFPQIVTQP